MYPYPDREEGTPILLEYPHYPPSYRNDWGTPWKGPATRDQGKDLGPETGVHPMATNTCEKLSSHHTMYAGSKFVFCQREYTKVECLLFL